MKMIEKGTVITCVLAALASLAFAHSPTDDALSAQVDEVVRAQMREQKIPGVSLAVLRDGKIIKATGYGLANVELNVPVTPQMVFHTESLAKAFTATAVMMLVEQGKIALDDKIAKYLPEAPPRWSEVTIRRLLTHTSGIRDYFGEDGDPTIDLQRGFTEDELVRSFAAQTMRFPTGEKWNYCNAGYVILGVVIHRVTGKFWFDFVKERIFDPLGMTSTRLISPEDIIPSRVSGYQMLNGEWKNERWVSPEWKTADGMLYTNVYDMAKWDAALYTEKVIKRSSLEQMWTPVTLNDGTTYPYGFAWRIREVNGHRLIQHDGVGPAFTTRFARYVNDRLSIIVLMNLGEDDEAAMPTRLTDSVAAIYIPRLALAASSGRPAVRVSITQVEEIYADAIDAVGVLTTINSGLSSTYQGRDRAGWEQRYREKRAQLVDALATISANDLSQPDSHALSLMRASLRSNLTENPYASASNFPSSVNKCTDATRKDLDSAGLRAALYSCFDTVGNKLVFEGRLVTRDSAIALLAQTADPQRRKALFLAFVPLWESINGHDELDSPCRRRIKFAAADAAAHGSRIDAAAGAIGQTTADMEHWLEQILDTWRQVLPDRLVEPWDYRFSGGEADRALADAMPLPSLLPINERYYRDLGADLEKMGVLYDIDPHPGKAPVTYANFVTMGRLINGKWRPTVARVSASYSESGLYLLNMLVHENGHAVHYCAIHNRPAFMDIGNDDIFAESFADVTSWNVYDPAWQHKYLGREVSESAGLRSQYTMVTLEVAWALFEARMLHKPDADPNAVWTDITSHYLHIAPHPGLSWWAQRVQLVDTPGYMINYGLGAVVTADLRRHIRESIGPFNTGNPRWYPWVSEHLLRFGLERETPELLRDFLGRPVSPKALLDDIRRLSPQHETRQSALLLQ